MKNGSRSEFFHVEGGLRLTRMRQSEWRRRWGIAGVVGFDVQVGANADDGYSNTVPFFDAGETRNTIGQWNSQINDSFYRFTNVTVPAGATITSAFLAPNASSSSVDGAGMLSNIYLSDEDDAVAPTSRAEHVADPRTTAFTAWDAEDFTIDVFTESPDISGAVQEVVDRGGWASSQAMMVLWDDDGSDNSKLYQIHCRDDVAAEAAKLHVEYTT